MRLFMRLGVLFCMLFGFLSWGTTPTEKVTNAGDSFTKGILTCHNFKKHEKQFLKNPRDTRFAFNYATCLAAKGEGDKALDIWNFLYKKQNSVTSAYMTILYSSTEGTFKIPNVDMEYNEILAEISKSKLSEEEIREQIEDTSEYFRVLALIDSDPSYPSSQTLDAEYESLLQMNLMVRYHIIEHYLTQYFLGSFVGGGASFTILTGDSRYDNAMIDLGQKYSSQLTDILQKTSSEINKFVSLEPKTYFNSDVYNKLISICEALHKPISAIIQLEKTLSQAEEKSINQEDIKSINQLKTISHLSVAGELASVLFDVFPALQRMLPTQGQIVIE